MENKSRKSKQNYSPLSVNIIIPLAGYTDQLSTQLLSILSQTHPFNALVCVTESEEDPAVPVIEKLKACDPRVVHINAGKTTCCSQKNHNLITGYLFLKEKGDVLVFCDSGHIAPPSWLENLLSPFFTDSTLAVSSGYHHVYPESSSLAIYCRAAIVTTLHLLRRIPLVSQSWGGATAIRSSDFQAMNVAGVWSTTVVDDVVLTALLQKNGRKMATPTGADTKTYIQSSSFISMINWLIRQIAYLKFVFPKTWLLLGVAIFLLSLGLYSSILILAGSFFWDLSQHKIIFSVAYLLFFLMFSLGLRKYHPSPGSLLYWYSACFLGPLIGCWCHGATWLTSTIVWSDTSYTVGRNGVVKHLEHES